MRHCSHGHHLLLKRVDRKSDRDPSLVVASVLRAMAVLAGYGDLDFNLCPQCAISMPDIFVVFLACLSIFPYGGVPRSDVISAALMEQAHAGHFLAPQATAGPPCAQKMR